MIKFFYLYIKTSLHIFYKLHKIIYINNLSNFLELYNLNKKNYLLNNFL